MGRVGERRLKSTIYSPSSYLLPQERRSSRYLCRYLHLLELIYKHSAREN
jgi:hypothetical protein